MTKKRSTPKRGLKVKPKAKRKPARKPPQPTKKRTIGQVLGLTPDKPVLEE